MVPAPRRFTTSRPRDDAPRRPRGAARKPGARRRGPRRRRFTFWRIAFVAATGLMTLFIALGAGLFMGYINSLPPIEELEKNPKEITLVMDRTGTQQIGEFKDVRRQVVPLEKIPNRLRNAFIATEDSRFYEHYGVDPVGVLRAIVVDLKAGHFRQGFSTITMQLVRNKLRTEVGSEKKISRKIKEAIYAFEIERRYTKDQILGFYLNEISFGGVGTGEIAGVQEAAAAYFSKNLEDLSIAEMAMLAAMPKAPSDYNPVLHPAKAVKRRNLVLKLMAEQDKITSQEFDRAVSEPLKTMPSNRTVDRYPYFTDALQRDLEKYYGVNKAQLKAAGFRITTTLDAGIQQACDAALREGLVGVERQWQEAKPSRHYDEMKDWRGSLRPGDVMLMMITAVKGDSVAVELDRYSGSIPMPDAASFYEPAAAIKAGQWIDVRVQSVDESKNRMAGVCAHDKPVQGSLVVLDAHTGEALAVVGGTSFYDPLVGGYNRAVMGGRQVGSCFKPFFYATAFERKNKAGGSYIQPNSLVVDQQVEYGTYKPQNYEHDFLGPITLIQALEHSRNVVTIRLFNYLGVRQTVRDVARFDFTQIGNRWDIPAQLPVCLGTIDCSPIQMAAAYQPFVNLGVGVRPQFFKNIVGADGRIAVPLRPTELEVLDPIPAYQTQYLMRQVVLHGTGATAIGDKFASPPSPPICGKTGTTDNCVDAWFTGCTPDLIIACQVGFDSPRPMGSAMTGGKVAGPIWAAAFKEILKTRDHWKMTFDAPGGIELANICADTGKRASDYCGGHDHKIYFNVPFPRGRAPRESCDGNGETPLIGSDDGGGGAPAEGVGDFGRVRTAPGVSFN